MELKNIDNHGWKYNQLWNGCILASIAHAIMVAHYPELSYEHSWDGMNYNIQDGEGIRGTVTFQNNSFVAAFRNDKTFTIESLNNNLFIEAPSKIIEIANKETTQYLLENIGGEILPAITTSIWGIEDKVFSPHSFDNIIKNGGMLLERQTMEPSQAIVSWKEYYEMTGNQIMLLKSIYSQKLFNPNKKIILFQEDIMLIGSDDEEGLHESETSFNEIGIEWAM